MYLFESDSGTNYAVLFMPLLYSQNAKGQTPLKAFG
jgi:hypothetical protein